MELTNELSSKEREYLIGVLTERLGTQREGVYHSDTSTFKDDMKLEEQLLRSLIEKLRSG